MVGMAGFTLMSLACALAQSPEMLIGFRVLQGLFGAVMLPQGLGMIKEMFPPEEIAASVRRVRPDHGPLRGRRPDPGRLAGRRGPLRLGLAHDLRDQHPDRGDRARWSAPRVLPRVPPEPRPCASTSRVPRSPSGAMVLLIYPLIQGREHGLAAVVLPDDRRRGRDVRAARRGASGAATGPGSPRWSRRACSASGRSPAASRPGWRSSPRCSGMSIVFTLFVQFGLGY